VPEAAATDRYFLSYSRSDEHLALRIAKALRSRGIAMWVDQFDIRPSEHWDRAIERAVRDCRGLVVIISPRSVASDNVADEISYAIEHRKSVLPIMIEKCSLPLRITRMHVVDATTGFDRAVDQCVAELRRSDGTSAVERSAPGQLDPRDIATAKQHFTSIVGPIGDIIVDKAAARSSTASELNRLLMQHIDNPADRASFARLTAKSNSPSADAKELAPSDTHISDGGISEADIESLVGTLTIYLGPIAPILARREGETAGSLEDLRLRLAALVPERDRADFLRRVQGG
jgi:hypothetical protein